MIYFDKETGAFLLSGKRYSYAFDCNRVGLLQHLYFGAKLAPEDLAFLVRAHGDPVSPHPDDFNFEMVNDRMPAETGSFGRGDFRPATVIVRRPDGAAMSRFRYRSHKVTPGATPLPGLPCVRTADETLTVTLRDEFSDAEADLSYTVSDASDVLVRHMTVRNAGEGTLDLCRAFSFSLDFADLGTAWHAMRFPGTWAQERIPAETPLAEGTLRIESTHGYTSHMMNPFLILSPSAFSETSGECYGFQLLYSGSFALTAEVSSYKTLRVQGGINDYLFSWHLPAGDEFVTPQAALCYAPDGLGGLSRAYHDFYREQVMPPAHAHAGRPVVMNNWEATYFDFDTEKLCSLIDEAAALGADTFVLDDGWFGVRNSDRTGLGDWTVNEEKLPGGLTAVTDRCRERGIRFGLWFEPEMVSEDSDLFRAHPDWAIAHPGVTPCRSRNQLVLDFSRPEVVDYVFEAVSKILNEYDISYVKWDRNRDITENWSASLPPERQGEFSHRCTLGFYRLAERLTSAFPGILFEGCAGGGGRFDGGMLYYFPQIWTSDDTDGLERTKIQWGTSFGYPVSSMSCHVSACPNHQTGRMTPFATRGAVASLGAFGYELDLTRLTDEEKAAVRRQIADYHRIEDLVLSGDLVRLIDPLGGKRFCEMLVSKDKRHAYVVGERFRGVPCDHQEPLRLPGLDPDTLYRVEELDLTVSGRALAGAGLILPRLRDCESWFWHIDAV